jgi:hypothetical protein
MRSCTKYHQPLYTTKVLPICYLYVPSPYMAILFTLGRLHLILYEGPNMQYIPRVWKNMKRYIIFMFQ